MDIAIQNVTQLVRFYDKGSFEERSPYVATATLLYENEYTVTVLGLNGDFNKEFYLLLWQYFNDNDITTMRIERKGEMVTKTVPVLKEQPKAKLLSGVKNQ